MKSDDDDGDDDDDRDGDGRLVADVCLSLLMSLIVGGVVCCVLLFHTVVAA